jgi:hypothetical protein
MSQHPHDHHRITPEGKSLGAQMVRLAEPWIHLLERTGQPDERCKTCAFLAETVPNGCLQTQMDVLKAVVEKVPFLCHQNDRKDRPCHGWLAAQVGIRHTESRNGPMPTQKVGWDFSPPDTEDTK